MKYVLALALLALTNWISLNKGFEYGADVGGCIAFDLMTEIPATQNKFCVRAEKTPLRHFRYPWVKMTDPAK